MFALQKHTVSITDINTRVELHGEDRKRGVDLKFHALVSNQLLDEFAKGLKESFFRKPTKGEQPDLPGVGPNQLTALQHPFLGRQKLPHVFEGCEIEIAGLMDHIEPTFLVDVKIHKFDVGFKEGGNVDMIFSASISDVDNEELVALSDAQLRGDARLSITPPAAQEQQKAA